MPYLASSLNLWYDTWYKHIMLCYMLRVASRCVMLPVAGTTCYALCHEDYGVRIYVEIVSLPEGALAKLLIMRWFFVYHFLKKSTSFPKLCFQSKIKFYKKPTSIPNHFLKMLGLRFHSAFYLFIFVIMFKVCSVAVLENLDQLWNLFDIGSRLQDQYKMAEFHKIMLETLAKRYINHATILNMLNLTHP